MNKINHAMRYAGKLVLTLCLLICLFIPTPAFALDYDAEAKNYLTSVQNELGSVKNIVQQLPNISVENGQKTLAEVQDKLDDIEYKSKQQAVFFETVSNNYQVSYQAELENITRLYDLYNKEVLNLPNGLGNLYLRLNEVNKSIQQYEQESRDLNKAIVLTDKVVSVLANNLEKGINLAKRQTNNIKEYAEALHSFRDPDILEEIKDLDQYIDQLTQKLPPPAFALDLDYNKANNYLSSVRSDLSSIKTIIQQLPNRPFGYGQLTLAKVQAKLETIESDSKQKADLFKNLSNNYQISYQDKLASITTLYATLSDLQKEYNQQLLYLPNGLGNFYIVNLNEINKSIQQYEQESRDLSKTIVLTNKVSVLANNLEKRINVAKQKTNNVKEYAEVLNSFSDPDILGEINDLYQYIGELTQNLPL